jgi:hypothetical protein
MRSKTIGVVVMALTLVTSACGLEGGPPLEIVAKDFAF